MEVAPKPLKAQKVIVAQKSLRLPDQVRKMGQAVKNSNKIKVKICKVEKDERLAKIQRIGQVGHQHLLCPLGGAANLSGISEFYVAQFWSICGPICGPICGLILNLKVVVHFCSSFGSALVHLWFNYGPIFIQFKSSLVLFLIDFRPSLHF